MDECYEATKGHPPEWKTRTRARNAAIAARRRDSDEEIDDGEIATTPRSEGTLDIPASSPLAPSPRTKVAPATAPRRNPPRSRARKVVKFNDKIANITTENQSAMVQDAASFTNSLAGFEFSYQSILSPRQNIHIGQIRMMEQLGLDNSYPEQAHMQRPPPFAQPQSPPTYPYPRSLPNSLDFDALKVNAMESSAITPRGSIVARPMGDFHDTHMNELSDTNLGHLAFTGDEFLSEYMGSEMSLPGSGHRAMLFGAEARPGNGIIGTGVTVNPMDMQLGQDSQSLQLPQQFEYPFSMQNWNMSFP